MSADCPSNEMLAALVEGRLDGVLLRSVHGHIDRCATCRQLAIAVVDSIPEEPPARPAAPTESAPPVASASPCTPPQRVDEFQILAMIGRGAMGQVYRAHDTVLDREVAIKFIAALDPSPHAKARFMREARAIARLTHPNVVTIYTVGEAAGLPYIVSEYAHGQSLDLLAKPIPWQRALAFGLDLAHGLAAAHKRGVLHRDLKPANAILTEEGQIKLLDFGLAKLLHPARKSGPASRPPESAEAQSLASSFASLPPISAAATAQVSSDSLNAFPAQAPAPDMLTRRGALMGTPLYMAPELWLRQPASHRSDVYALGAVLFELCVGRPPHKEDTLAELEKSVLESAAPPLLSVAPEVDAGLAGVIDQCLSRAKTGRYADGESVYQALAALQARAAPARRVEGRPGARSARILAALDLVMVGVFTASQLALATGPENVLLPGGAFAMGSSKEEVDSAFAWAQRTGCTDCQRELYEREQPTRKVQVSRYYLDTTEVTSAKFAAWLNTLSELRIGWGRQVFRGDVLLLDMYPKYGCGGIRYLDGAYAPRQGMANLPVTLVTWDAAQLYCRAHGGRLPTEAEWEFAARGRTGFRYPWGDDDPDCAGVVFARADEQSRCARGGAGLGPSPVGLSAQDVTPHRFYQAGVHDLAGNVAEWVLDRFSTRYPSCAGLCRDPVVLAAGEPEVERASGSGMRVVRGGAWFRGLEACRAAGRARQLASAVTCDIGFRCARSAEPQDPVGSP